MLPCIPARAPLRVPMVSLVGLLHPLQVVEKSTVPVKTAEAIEKILTHTKTGVKFEVSLQASRNEESLHGWHLPPLVDGWCESIVQQADWLPYLILQPVSGRVSHDEPRLARLCRSCPTPSSWQRAPQ